MDRDYIIRVLIDAKDNLSRAIKSAVDKSNLEFSKISAGTQRVGRGYQDLERVAVKSLRAIDKEAARLKESLAGFDKIDFAEVQKRMRRLFDEQERDRNERLNEEVSSRKEAIREEIAARRIAERQLAVERARQTQNEIAQRQTALSDEVKALREASALQERTDRRNLREEIRARRVAFAEEENERRIEHQRTLKDLSIERSQEEHDDKKELIDDEVDRRKQMFRDESIARKSSLDEEIAAMKNSLDDQIRLRKDALDREIAGRKAAVKAEISELRSGLNRVNDQREEDLKREIELRKNALSEEIRVRKQAFRQETAEKRAFFKEQLINAQKSFVLADAGDTGGGLRRFASGLENATNKTKRLSDAQREGASRMFNFGFTIRRTIADVDRFVNLRWLLIIGFLNVLGNGVAIVGANLLALASSASRAAVALGGALVAGIGQLIPVLLLLQGTMTRLDKVMDAVDATEKARLSASEDAADAAKAQTEANERLADAQYNLKRANESVLDSELDLKNAQRDLQDAIKSQRRAVEDLADARKKASEDIVDATLEEKEASLALEEAELAVLEAKQRLREEEQRSKLGGQDLEFARAQVREAQERLKIVTAQGDQAEVSSAHQQLQFAEQNLNAILNTAESRTTELKQAQLAVERAELNRKQAVVRDRRAQRDAQTARGEGVEGSDEVISALERVEQANRNVLQARRAIINQTRALRDANHNVAIALREIRDAHRDATDAANNQSSSQKALNESLKDLTPAERALVTAIDRFKRNVQREFGPIQDIIIRAFTRAVRRVEKLLLDPSIQRAARKLASSIATVIDLFSKFTLTQEFRDALVFFTENAARNVPKIGEAFLDIIRILIRIGRVATPIFNDLLDRIVKVISRIEGWSRNTERLENIFSIAGRHLNSWIGLARAVGNVFAAFLIQSGPALEGKNLLEDITKLLNGWAEWIRENPETIHKFFRNMRTNLEALAGTFGRFAKILFEVFTSEESAAFSRLIIEVVLPAFGAFIVLLGKLSRILIFLFDIPVVGQLLKWGVQAAIIYGLFNRLFALFGLASRGAFSKLLGGLTNSESRLRRLGRALVHPITSLRNLRDKFVEVAAKAQAFANTLQQRVRDTLAKSAELVGRLRDRAKEAAKALADKTVAALNAAKTLAGRFRDALIKAAIELQILTQRAGTAAVGALRRFAAFITTVVVNALRILRLNIRLLMGATGVGLIILGALLIIEHWDKVKLAVGKLIEALKRVVDWIRNNWKDIAKIVLIALLGPAGVIFLVYKFRDKLLGVFGKIKDGIIAAFREAFAWIKREFLKLGDFLERKIREIPVIGKLIAPENKLSNSEANRILTDQALNYTRPKIRQLRKQGLQPIDIIAQLLTDGEVSEELLRKLVDKYVFHAGGTVPGAEGKAVPILAHAGEWVVNKAQQSALAKRLGESAQQISNWLFGTNRGQGKPGMKTTGTRDAPGTKNTYTYRDFDLRAQVDPDGVTVWFIEQADGTFGQVSAKDAKKIIATHGTFIPGYVKRSTHGFNLPLKKAWERTGKGRFTAFAGGGIVAPSYNLGGIQSFENGGVVLNTPHTNGGVAGSPKVGTLNQNFEVNSEGNEDWNYIFRLGAMHAQGSF